MHCTPTSGHGVQLELKTVKIFLKTAVMPFLKFMIFFNAGK